jgi:hypothetical protein
LALQQEDDRFQGPSFVDQDFQVLDRTLHADLRHPRDIGVYEQPEYENRMTSRVAGNSTLSCGSVKPEALNIKQIARSNDRPENARRVRPEAGVILAELKRGQCRYPVGELQPRRLLY